MSKNDKKRIHHFVIDSNVLVDWPDWSHTTESKFAYIKWRFEDIEAFAGKYKENSEIKEHFRKAVEREIRHREKISANEKPETKISSAPGSYVLRIAEFLCTKKVYDRVFHQAIISMREEYFEALAAGRKEKAVWVKARGYLWLTWTVLFQLLMFVVSGPAKIIRSLWG